MHMKRSWMVYFCLFALGFVSPPFPYDETLSKSARAQVSCCFPSLPLGFERVLSLALKAVLDLLIFIFGHLNL